MTRRRQMSQKKQIYMIISLVVVIIALLITYFSNQKSETADETKVDVSDISDCFVRVLDVGQGDSIMLSSRGRNALIDTGTPEFASELCSKVFKFGAKKLDAVLLTHNHDDHVGGAEAIADRFSIDNLILPDLVNTESKTRIISNAKSETLASDGECYTAKQGMFMNIGDIKLTVLACYYDQDDENERSIVAMAQIGKIKFLLTGDAGTSTENRMIKEGIDLDCDVLKVGHHGSSTASGRNFLNECTPKYAAISCGKNNQYSHPHEETIRRLEKIGAEIYRTDTSGDITFYVENGKITPSCEK